MMATSKSRTSDSLAVARPPGENGQDILLKPSAQEINRLADETAQALDRVRTAGAGMGQLERAVSSTKKEDRFIRYIPDEAAPGYNPKCAERIIRITEKQIDPLEPAKFRARRAPHAIVEEPVSIHREPAKKLTPEDQAMWKLPPCISNWKNQQGYTIPLDMRLQADGRGLQEVSVNNKFAQFAESLYVAERLAREEINLKNDLERQRKQMEEAQREEKLRDIAAKARAERNQVFTELTATAPPLHHNDVKQEDDHKQSISSSSSSNNTSDEEDDTHQKPSQIAPSDRYENDDDSRPANRRGRRFSSSSDDSSEHSRSQSRSPPTNRARRSPPPPNRGARSPPPENFGGSVSKRRRFSNDDDEDRQINHSPRRHNSTRSRSPSPLRQRSFMRDRQRDSNVSYRRSSSPADDRRPPLDRRSPSDRRRRTSPFREEEANRSAHPDQLDRQPATRQPPRSRYAPPPPHRRSPSPRRFEHSQRDYRRPGNERREADIFHNDNRRHPQSRPESRDNSPDYSRRRSPDNNNRSLNDRRYSRESPRRRFKSGPAASDNRQERSPSPRRFSLEERNSGQREPKDYRRENSNSRRDFPARRTRSPSPPPRQKIAPKNNNSQSKYDNDDNHEENRSSDERQLQAKAERLARIEAMERERRREIRREFRLERAGKKRFKPEEDRDISEKIALGQAVPTAQEGLYDARLFNRDPAAGNMADITVADDDEDDTLYDRPLFTDKSKIGRSILNQQGGGY